MNTTANTAAENTIEGNVGNMTTADGPLKAGWICLAIACVLILVPFPTAIFYAPLCFAVLVLSIVAMTRGGQTGKAILLMVASFIVPAAVYMLGITLGAASLS